MIVFYHYIITLQAPLGIIFKDENVNQGMHSILKQFHSYLPRRADDKVDSQIFSWDQLTVERAVNVIASVANGLSEHDRLEGMNFQIGDWHAGVKLLSVSASNVANVSIWSWLTCSDSLI
jgi:hypothetical protein